MVGERYGRLQCGESCGNDYVTMGGGVALSAALVEAVLERCEGCKCPAPDVPDDMEVRRTRLIG
jgi:hypothetical protein